MADPWQDWKDLDDRVDAPVGLVLFAELPTKLADNQQCHPVHAYPTHPVGTRSHIRTVPIRYGQSCHIRRYTGFAELSGASESVSSGLEFTWALTGGRWARRSSGASWRRHPRPASGSNYRDVCYPLLPMASCCCDQFIELGHAVPDLLCAVLPGLGDDPP